MPTSFKKWVKWGPQSRNATSEGWGTCSTLGDYSRKSSWLLNSSWLRKSLPWGWSSFCFGSLKYRPYFKGVRENIHMHMLENESVSHWVLCLFATRDCSPLGSSVHGILQARILEWVAMPSSRASSQPRDQTPVSCTAGGFFRATWLGLGKIFFLQLSKATVIITLQLNHISPIILLGMYCKDACSTAEEMGAQTR